MNYFIPLLLLTASLGIQHTSYSQTNQKPTFVIVHGAWGGSWAFKKVDSLLTQKGITVYRPSLTGQGERVHLASKDVGLSTHINDVVNMIMYEDLNNVILIGHSYGGMVVTGVADSLPSRIKKLIYLDAFVPENGESALDLLGPRSDWFNKMTVDGYAIPPWVAADQSPPKDVPQSYQTFNEKIKLDTASGVTIPTAYIQTVATGTEPKDDDFASQAERAKKKKWSFFQLEADHNPQWSVPVILSDLLFKIGI